MTTDDKLWAILASLSVLGTVFLLGMKAGGSPLTWWWLLLPAGCIAAAFVGAVAVFAAAYWRIH